MSTNVVQIATLNLERMRRIDLLGQLVTSLSAPVDVLYLQETRPDDALAKVFRAEQVMTDALADRFGDDTGVLRGLYTAGNRGPMGQVVFVRQPRVHVLSHHRPGPDAWDDKVGNVEVEITGRRLLLRAEHWPYWSGNARLDVAQHLTKYAETPAIFGGDYNSMWVRHEALRIRAEVRDLRRRVVAAT